jgi:hypothetical protein
MTTRPRTASIKERIADKVVRATEIEALALKTCAGDVRDFLLHRLRQEQDKRAWSDRSEDEQRATINAAQHAAEEVVRGVVALFANHGLPSIGGLLESVTAKAGMKAVIGLDASSETEAMALLRAASGYGSKQVVIVLADAGEFMDDRAPVVVKPDQPRLLSDPEFVEVAGDEIDKNPPSASKH